MSSLLAEIASCSPGLEPVILLLLVAVNPTLFCQHFLVATVEMAHSRSYLWLILRLGLSRHINDMRSYTSTKTWSLQLLAISGHLPFKFLLTCKCEVRVHMVLRGFFFPFWQQTAPLWVVYLLGSILKKVCSF